MKKIKNSFLVYFDVFKNSNLLLLFGVNSNAKKEVKKNLQNIKFIKKHNSEILTCKLKNKCV